jgi:hypothetical protein
MKAQDLKKVAAERLLKNKALQDAINFFLDRNEKHVSELIQNSFALGFRIGYDESPNSH